MSTISRLGLARPLSTKREVARRDRPLGGQRELAHPRRPAPVLQQPPTGAVTRASLSRRAIPSEGIAATPSLPQADRHEQVHHPHHRVGPRSVARRAARPGGRARLRAQPRGHDGHVARARRRLRRPARRARADRADRRRARAWSRWPRRTRLVASTAWPRTPRSRGCRGRRRRRSTPPAQGHAPADARLGPRSTLLRPGLSQPATGRWSTDELCAAGYSPRAALDVVAQIGFTHELRRASPGAWPGRRWTPASRPERFAPAQQRGGGGGHAAAQQGGEHEQARRGPTAPR